MKQKKSLILATIVAVLLITACGGLSTKELKQEADKEMEALYKAKDYKRILIVADSLEKAGYLSTVKSYYWRGDAYDRLKQKEQAEQCWKVSMEAGEKSEDQDDNIAYAKSASRLANLLCIRGNYEETKKLSQAAIERLEAQKCDTTSDYLNLLIYIGCCQSVLAEQIDTKKNGFYRAYDKHMENVSKKHTDGAYKDAIAGLINIAYFCVKAKKYEDALYYTRHFGELLGEYEMRPGVNEEYIDRQLGRYDIYKAQALKGIGKNQEAAETYDAFQATKFSKSSEGQQLAEYYLNMNL